MVPAGILVTVAAAATCIFATPLKGSSRVANRDLVKKHAHVQVPRDWEMLDDHLEGHRHTISLQIGLKQANFDGLVKVLYEVSDPAHPRYGKHLSQA
jgi:tripeptidyl-peptidase I